MARMTNADHHSVLDFLYEAEGVEGDDPFPVPVLEALKRAVPCDVVSYGDYDVTTWRTRIRHSRYPELPDAVREAKRRYVHQDPIPPSRRTAGSALKYSDFLTKREWQRRELYQYVLRPTGIDDTLRLWLVTPQGLVGSFDFDVGDRRSASGTGAS